jgi:hypothetical protein
VGAQLLLSTSLDPGSFKKRPAPPTSPPSSGERSRRFAAGE